MRTCHNPAFNISSLHELCNIKPPRSSFSFAVYCMTRHKPQSKSTAMISRPSCFFLASGFLLLQLVVSQATCYLPDGSVAFGDKPCGSSLPSICCAGQCLSNGLCFTPSDNMLARSSCTDQSWESSVCTSYCKGSKSSLFQ
jgi:hypothetical protein